MITKIHLLLFLLFPLIFIAQTPINTLTIRKSCCDSLGITMMALKNQDTISYQQLDDEISMGISFKNCQSSVSASIHSFEISINEGKKQFINGNTYDFKAIEELRPGGTITISNCMVICKYKSNNPVRIILPPKKISVRPVK